jgi:hypothetical protein
MTTHTLQNPAGIVVSPDGKHVYVSVHTATASQGTLPPIAAMSPLARSRPFKRVIKAMSGRGFSASRSRVWYDLSP